MINYYDILGIGPDASPEEIKAAYMFQIKVVHPDRYDPTTQPAQHARALKLSERLNQARDTLLDATARQAYDAQLLRPAAPGPEPAPPPPPQPIKRRDPKPALIAAGLLALMAVGIGVHPTSQPVAATSQATPAPTLVPCPVGAPTVAITNIEIQPDTTADMPGDLQNRRLYIITGTIDNPTASPVHVSDLGFYLGAPNSDLPPDWTQDLNFAELSGDPGHIPAHSSLAWKAKNVVEWPVNEKGPHPANVTATLTFPYTPTTKPEAQWYWPEADVTCSN